jgi:hypothetical protein
MVVAPFRLKNMKEISIKSNGSNRAGKALIPVNMKETILIVEKDLKESFPKYHWDIECCLIRDEMQIFCYTYLCDECYKEHDSNLYDDKGEYKDPFPSPKNGRPSCCYQWETEYPNHSNYSMCQ